MSSTRPPLASNSISMLRRRVTNTFNLIKNNLERKNIVVAPRKKCMRAPMMRGTRIDEKHKIQIPSMAIDLRALGRNHRRRFNSISAAHPTRNVKVSSRVSNASGQKAVTLRRLAHSGLPARGLLYYDPLNN